MENVKNEIVVSKDFNKNFTAFKNAMNKTNENMGKASVAAYNCAKENKKEFTKRCGEAFPDLAQSTISKMVNAGLIMVEATEKNLELPDTYSKVYELAPVREQLDNFYEYVDEHEQYKTVPEMTQKEIREAVEHYQYDEEDVVEDVDDVEDEVEEDEVEEVEEVEVSVERANLENIAKALQAAIPYITADNIEETKNVLTDIVEDILQVANTL